MNYLVLEHAAAMLSDADPARTGHVLLVSLGMDFGELDSMKVRDLADLRPIITQEAFDSLCARQHVMLHTMEGDDVDQLKWTMDVLSRIIPNCSAPVTALHFVDGRIERIASSVNYSVPSGIAVATGARIAA